ncbi:MAG: hypothetical protein ACD_58C00204G0001 [uncultured bacterium]|nr:MAG: hypothetical protein ACD_58C00204G0001 [uncultured bacterium]
MPGYLYILQSNDGKYYVGSTNDVNRRLKQHQSGHTHSTKRMKDLKLVFSQEFLTLKNARQIEKKIKSWKRKDFIDKIIRDGRISSGSGAVGSARRLGR